MTKDQPDPAVLKSDRAGIEMGGIALREPAFLLLLLGIIPLLVIIFRSMRSTERTARTFGIAVYHTRSFVVGRALIVGAIVAMFAGGLAQPYVETVKTTPIRTDAQVAFLVDVSLSMAGSQTAESPLRVDRAKKTIVQTAQKIVGVPVGVYAFSNITVPQLPFTVSRSGFKELFEVSVNAGMLQGASKAQNATNVWQAAAAVGREFDPKAGKKVIIVISDGDNGTDVFRDVALTTLSELGVVVFTVNVGSPDERIWLRDKNGTVVGKDPTTLPVRDGDLRLLAERTGGQFFTESNILSLPEAVDSVLGEGDSTESVVATVQESFSSFFFLCAILGIVFFVVRYVR